MAFLENDTPAQERFNLLLLDPGEIYFEDFSVFYYPHGLPEAEAIRRKQRGHLKICSKSIVFVPKETQYPILKFPLKQVREIDEWAGGLFSRMDFKDKVLKLVSDLAVEMKEKNIISPYVFKKTLAEHKFSLNYVTVDDCLPQMCQLHRASTLPPADQSAMINAIVLSRQSRVKFNTSWLEDLYENILLETQGDRITPLVTNPGRIMLTSSRLYFQPFNNIDRVPVIKIRLKDITRVIKRRFLLRQLGLEIYCREGLSIPHLYLHLKTEEVRNSLYRLILLQPGLNLDDTGQEDMSLKWQNGHISNYEYLLYLNSLADRSFNDLTQYPVLPWVIQDYSRSEFDLEDPSMFRDLSKPIGALNEERLSRMKERYIDMPEPKFLYGSHYSTPGYVLFYLARIAPEYVLCLQNGKFDQPDRMFNSLQETWENCLNGAADFKELIPEFYEGSGEFLINSGITNFGIRQDGRQIGNVEIPSWETGPGEFIQKLRQALECDHVSQHLHEWIDLIFGFKQRGEESEKADNVFHYLTYEGAIDLNSIEDPNERACMEIQIMEFGQVPKQLFTTPHPQRFCTTPVARLITRSFTETEPEPVVENDDHPAQTTDDEQAENNSAEGTTNGLSLTNLEALTHHLQHSLHKDAVTDIKIAPDGKFIFSVSQDSLLKMYSLEDQRQLRSVNMSSMVLSSCEVMPDSRTIIVGSWDNSVYFYSIEFGRILDSLSAHDDAVSSICWRNNLLLTASWDSTVKVWQFQSPGTLNSFVAAEYIGQLDHDSGVSCLCPDMMASLLVTGTRDGQLCIWDLQNYYMASQHLVHHGKINAVLLSPDSRRVLSCGEDHYLRVMDMETGTEIFVKDVEEELLCMCWMGDAVMAGSSSGNLQVWDMDKAQQIHQLSAHKDAVTCLDVRDRCLLTGSKDGTVSLWKL